MSEPQWVKLHLVPQTEMANTMPPFIAGLMTGETLNGYVLNPALELDEDEAGSESYTAKGMSIINKTYVWRCEILNTKPTDADLKKDASEAPDDGGLG